MNLWFIWNFLTTVNTSDLVPSCTKLLSTQCDVYRHFWTKEKKIAVFLCFTKICKFVHHNLFFSKIDLQSDQAVIRLQFILHNWDQGLYWVKTYGLFTNKPWRKSRLVSQSQSKSWCRSARWWLVPRLTFECHNQTGICFTNTRNYCHRNKITVLTSLLKQTYLQPALCARIHCAVNKVCHYCCHNGPLTRYVKLRVAHAPGMPGTFRPTADFKGNR